MRALTILFLASFTRLVIAQSYGLEEWTNKHAQNIAPPKIQKFMQNSIRKHFLDCVNHSQATPTEALSYFGSVEIPLNTKGAKCHLVFPSKYCSAFYGAHAIAYWILAESEPGIYKIIFSGRSDGITIRETTTKGFYDFESGYNNSFSILKYNGRSYRKVGSGEYPYE